MLYEPLSASDAQKTNNLYLKGHTDFGTITMLFSQPVAGLQIRVPNGEWKWVKVRLIPFYMGSIDVSDVFDIEY